VSPAILPSGVLGHIFSARLRTRSVLNNVALGVLCLAFFFIAYHHAPPEPFISGDSPGYIDFSSQRTAGYPVFLRFISWADGGLAIASPLQLAMLCAGTALFAIGLCHLLGSFWSGLLGIVLVLGNYEIVKYSFWILTDGPFISLTLAMLGSVALWLATKKGAALASASVFFAAATTVRPDGIVLLPMLVIIYVAMWPAYRQPARALALLALPAAGVFALNAIAYHSYHKSWQPNSVLGINLLGKAARLADGSEASDHKEWIANAVAIVSPLQPRFAIGETWMDRALISAPVYDGIRHALDLFPGEKQLLSKEDLGDGAHADRAMIGLAIDIIRAHELAYLHIVAENYAATWYIPQLLSRSDAKRLRDGIDEKATPSDRAEMIESIPEPRPWPFVAVMHAFQIAVFALSIGFLIGVPLSALRGNRPDAAAWFGCSAAVSLHLGFLLVAVVNETKPRLTLDYWPLEALIVVVAAAFSARRTVVLLKPARALVRVR
jgi:hypothetical protein